MYTQCCHFKGLTLMPFTHQCSEALGAKNAVATNITWYVWLVVIAALVFSYMGFVRYGWLHCRTMHKSGN